MGSYEAVIGLEVHAQLATRTKLFCGCRAEYGGEPNTRVCPVCSGMPGALPVLNRRAVVYAVAVGVAMRCSVAPESVFARKNYFYPDCPKNYQITQFDTPLCAGGRIDLEDHGRTVGITRIHLEEDAGKLVHDAGCSLVDLNRSGVPLIEIVSEPDMRTPAEARSYVQKLRTILRYLDVCDGNMEEGGLRCDINVSLRPTGGDKFGVKTEIKNVNSFRFVEQALEFEIERQRGILESGGSVTQDTLLWDGERGRAEVMRSKEDAHDYRYFPEPDLLPLRVPAQVVEKIAAKLPELPDARKDRFVKEYGLPESDAGVLAASRDLADYFEAAAAASGDARAAGNWVMGEVLRELHENDIRINRLLVTPQNLALLINAAGSGRVNSNTAKAVFCEMAESGKTAEDIISARSLEQITDEDVLHEAVRRAIDENPDAAAKYRAGKEQLLEFFIGQVMKATAGKAAPRRTGEIIRSLLGPD
jgi:aspartyl-tRNA(Asn)/glutamyl-tRNA(Gln) amidotransferase subunit B